MGFLDAAKDKINELMHNEDATDQAIEKVGDAVDEKTGGQFADKVDQAQSVADEKLGDA